MEIIFNESAAKHGYTREDAINAIANPSWKKKAFAAPRDGGATRPDGVIGHAINGDEIEVFYAVLGDRIVIFHCMQAREFIRNQLDDTKE